MGVSSCSAGWSGFGSRLTQQGEKTAWELLAGQNINGSSGCANPNLLVTRHERERIGGESRDLQTETDTNTQTCY